MLRPIEPGSPFFIALVAAMMTMTALSIDINLPAIPAIAEDLGTTVSASQLTVSLFFVGFSGGQILWGPLSDRTGRKPALLVGIALYLLATLACLVAPSIELLLAMRVLQGFGAGVGSILGRAVIRDSFAGAEMARAMSFALAAFITAPIIAPSIGALLLAVSGWRAIFGFLLVYGVVLFAIVAVFFGETLRARDRGALHPARFVGGYRAVFGDPRSRHFAWITVATFGTLTVYLTNTPTLFMQRYGVSPGTFGLIFAVIAIASSAGNITNARLIRRLEMRTVIGLGIIGQLLAAAVSIMVAAVVRDGWWLVPGLALFFFCFGLVVANATSLSLLPHGDRVGAATSALGFTQTLIPALIASVVAWTHGAGLVMLTTMLVLAMVAKALQRAAPYPAPHAGPTQTRPQATG